MSTHEKLMKKAKEDSRSYWQSKGFSEPPSNDIFTSYWTSKGFSKPPSTDVIDQYWESKGFEVKHVDPMFPSAILKGPNTVERP